jgi:hypothetical protein
MKPATAEAFAEIKNAIAQGQTRIAPCIFSHCFGRAATSAAFRMAKQQGLIEVAYISVVGTPVYQAAGTKAAVEEAKSAVIN